MATDFGSDLSAWPDLDAGGALISGTAGLAQAIARRLVTPRGGLVYDQLYGTDVRQLIGDTISADRIFAIQQAIESEAADDERVLSASAVVTLNAATNTLTVSLTVQTADGAFQMVLGIGAVTLTLLKAG